jgi:hypothetical protein
MNIDIFSAFFQALEQIWFLIPIGLIAMIMKTPWFKGVLGEFVVNLAAKLFLPKDTYHLIKNVTLPTEEGDKTGTTQIDHIIVSRFGIFVVETKNMKGWIFGSEKQKTWTQKIFKHSQKFQNPLHQNYKHTKTLETCLGIPSDKIFSVIVFVGDSAFKTEMPENVRKGHGYIRYIKSKKEILLSDDDVIQIVEQIQAGRLTPSFKTHREHVKHVKTIVAEKNSKPSKRGVSDRSLDKTSVLLEQEASDLSRDDLVKECPKCGAPMVKRQAKKGQNAGNEFWGCSSFPKCRSVCSI